ncbi:hypothetical protein GCM10025770_09130 [Viridibacterium curvum]|uniref:DUF4238 domain-containing protein n=1 Tax=Viridibacterium curvum TaxID=1101404 RepID=A0ABP9QEZ9_9RHOO
MLNLDRKKLIPNAPVKNQCSRDYFYGQDENLEKAIQIIESKYGQALIDLTKNRFIPTDDIKDVLKIFWLFQHQRTEAAALRAVELAEATAAAANIPTGKYTLEIKAAVQIACKAFLTFMHEIDDLKFCVIKNKTDFPFVTSDNPAVLTNRWRLEKDRMPGHSFGLGSAGMLALLPLTPKLFFLGYDGDVYNIPNERGVATIRSVRDVKALNQHQFLQCVANVYLHDASYEKALIEHFTEVEPIRPKRRHIVNYAQLDSVFDGRERYVLVPPTERDPSKESILHTRIIHPKPGMWPSLIRLRTNGSVYTNGTGAGYVRFVRAQTESARPFWKERP